MPTIFSHAIFAAAAGKGFIDRPVSFWFWFLIALCAIIPDADVVGAAFGIKYGSLLAHRGLSHSIFFSVLFGSTIAYLVHKFLLTGLSLPGLIIYFSLATLSHPLLDMLTDGGPGVALFAPFSGERYFSPWRPIEVSPIGFRFFSSRGLEVILSEIIWIWLPALVFLFPAKLIFKRMKPRSETM